MKKYLLTCSITGFAILAGCGGSGPATVSASAPKLDAAPGRIVLPAGSPKLARIRVSAVETAMFPADEVIAPGKVEANPNRISRVLAPVAGRVRRVLVKLGDAVGEGQPLASFDSPEAGAAITAFRQAEAQIRQAESALAKAQKDLDRLRDLNAHRAAALKDVLAAENDLTQAQAARDQAQAAADDAKHRLDLLGIEPGAASQEVFVRAPIPGKVLEIGVVPGEYRNDASASLMTIADLRTVWISADVPESEIRHVGLGENIEVQLTAFPGETFRARVARIADTLDPTTRTVKVQAEIPNPSGKLRPEMFGQIRHDHGDQPAPAVPAGAIVQRGGKNVVMVEESAGVFREIEVTVGARKGDLIAIASGVKPGDRIVTDGPMLVTKD